MNYIINQSGEPIIAVGSPGSNIRNKDEFNITLPKLIDLINRNWEQTGILRHTATSDLEYILEDDGVPRSKWNNLIQSAYYYSIIK